MTTQQQSSPADIDAKTIRIFSGNGNPDLANRIATYIGIPLGKITADKFSNTERRVEIGENIRQCDVFLIQTGSFSDNFSVNDIIMETLIMIDACRRSDAKSITVIMAHYPYCRQDKKDRPRAPISARLMADLLENSGITRLIVMDLHASQIQGFFSIPVDNLYSVNLMIDHFRNTLFQGQTQEEIQSKYVLVSPDAGGIKRMLSFADKLQLKSVIMHKQRDHTQKSKVDQTLLIGASEMIQDKVCIVLDDMADTLGTVTKACETLSEAGAKEVIVAVTHGILSGPALERLNACAHVSKLITSNTLPQEENMKRASKIEVFDTSMLFAQAIWCIVKGNSISALFT